MEQVIGVGWPGSGQQRLAAWLAAYFGERFRQGPTQAGAQAAGQMLPGEVPRPEEPHLSRDFDANGDFPQLAGRRYILQHRGLVPMLVASYERFLLATPGEKDSKERFRSFCSTRFGAWKAFEERWIRAPFAEGQLVLSREQLVLYPRDCLLLAIWWIAPEEKIDEAKVDRALARVGLEPQDADPARFRHYDKPLFAQLARLTLPREAVAKAFRDLLGRDPDESNYLQFQELASLAKMEDVLRASEEYRKRAAKLASMHKGETS